MAQCYNLIDAMKTPKNKNLLIEERLEIVLVCFSMENENFSLGTRRKMFIIFFFIAGKSTSCTFVGFAWSYKCLAQFQPGVVWRVVTIATACTVLYIMWGDIKPCSGLCKHVKLDCKN